MNLLWIAVIDRSKISLLDEVLSQKGHLGWLTDSSMAGT